jgi:ribosomal protein S18 acetylase RimI-like enzyme
MLPSAGNGWRAMTPSDLPRVGEIAAAVHAAYPEDAAVFAERLRLYPAGCRVLEAEGLVRGYALSHPWHVGEPPALNSLLGALPAKPDAYYLHDLALLPEARSCGAGSAIVAALVEQARAERLNTLSLVAVHGSAAFWRRHGFATVEDAMLAEKLRSYGVDARFMVRRLG